MISGLISSRSGRRVNEPSSFSASNDTNAGRPIVASTASRIAGTFHELRLLDQLQRGMKGYQHVYRQQGCDRGLQIDALDDELLQDQDGTQRYQDDVPKES